MGRVPLTPSRSTPRTVGSAQLSACCWWAVSHASLHAWHVSCLLSRSSGGFPLGQAARRFRWPASPVQFFAQPDREHVFSAASGGQECGSFAGGSGLGSGVVGRRYFASIARRIAAGGAVALVCEVPSQRVDRVGGARSAATVTAAGEQRPQEISRGELQPRVGLVPLVDCSRVAARGRLRWILIVGCFWSARGRRLAMRPSQRRGRRL